MAKKQIRKFPSRQKIQKYHSYNKIKFKLDSESMLKFRLLEGKGKVPSYIFTKILNTLVKRNFNINEDDDTIKKFTIQLLSLMGLLAIYNNDRIFYLDEVFKLQTRIDKAKNNIDDKYIFTFKTYGNPKSLTSYLYNILYEKEEVEEIEKKDDLVELNNILTEFLEKLCKDSKERLEELS